MGNHIDGEDTTGRNSTNQELPNKFRKKNIITFFYNLNTRRGTACLNERWRISITRLS